MRLRCLAVGAATLATVFAVNAIFYAVTTPAQQMPGMSGQPRLPNPTPSVKRLYQGKEILFIHTEVSDSQVARMLTSIMGPKVLTVPGLARVPRSLLADVYVFTNGVKGGGPFGFQPDVFDSVPGTGRYTPLRAVTLVTGAVLG